MSTVSFVLMQPSTLMALKLLVSRLPQGPLHGLVVDVGIGQDESQQRRHVGLDHAGALRDPADAALAAADGPLAELHFGVPVRRHDGLGGFGNPAGGEPLDETTHAAGHLVDGQLPADDARRGHEDLGFVDLEGPCAEPGRLHGVLVALVAGCGIGIAAVDDDGPRGPALDALHVEKNRRCLENVRREDARRLRRHFGVQKRQVLFAVLLDPRRDPRGLKPGNLEFLIFTRHYLFASFFILHLKPVA